MLQQGNRAPISTTVFDEKGKSVSLQQYQGYYVVLYFYPKDNTPGCTVEACNFRDANTEIEQLGAVIIGVSKDSIASHQKFQQKHELNFPLWSDPDHTLMQAFGTWGKRKFAGVSYEGTARATFVIDPKGTIIRVWEKVTPVGHAEEVLNFLRT